MSDADDWLSVRILRQDRPEGRTIGNDSDFVERRNLTLRRTAASPETENGEFAAPAVYEADCLEEVSGSCAMLVDG